MCQNCISRRKFISATIASAISASLLSAIFLGAILLSSCVTNPISGRSQLSLVSNSQIQALAGQEWNKIKSSIPRSKNKNNINTTQRVGEKIAQASGLPGDWEFVVFARDELNAFVLPGGKVGVYDGIFKAAKNDDQLAAVLGHEIAHVAGKHVKERYSQQLLYQAIFGALQESKTLGDTSLLAAQLGASLLIFLPFSRDQELEADIIGLRYMKKAGFEIEQAIEFWQNMQSSAGGSAPPQLLSTHPSSQNRIKAIKEEIKKLQSAPH